MWIVNNQWAVDVFVGKVSHIMVFIDYIYRYIERDKAIQSQLKLIIQGMDLWVLIVKAASR